MEETNKYIEYKKFAARITETGRKFIRVANDKISRENRKEKIKDVLNGI